MKRNKIIKNIIRILFIIYIAALLSVLVFKLPTRLAADIIQRWFQGGKITHGTIQWVPFKTIVAYAGQVRTVTDWFFKNLCCNLVIFIPYGMLLPVLLKKRKILKTFLSGVLLILGIEWSQYLFGIGLCDIDDFILNTISVLIGCGCYKILKFMRQNISARHKA